MLTEEHAVKNNTIHFDLMLDLETMGNNPLAPVVSIGAVFFTPDTGEMGASFYTPVHLQSEIDCGAVPDGDTIIWWLKQSDEAREAITCSRAMNINNAVNLFNSFIANNCPPYKKLKIWGNGASFDNVIFRQACKRAGWPAIWEYWNDRDVRTVVELGKKIGFDPKRDMPFDGERHNALADAIHQAKYVSAIYKKLLAPHI